PSKRIGSLSRVKPRLRPSHDLPQKKSIVPSHERSLQATSFRTFFNRKAGMARNGIRHGEVFNIDPGGKLLQITGTGVVHQDGRGSCFYIVRVQLLDGEVVHLRRAGASVDRGDTGVLATVGVEDMTGVEPAGDRPSVGGVVPETVVRGCVDRFGMAIGRLN